MTPQDDKFLDEMILFLTEAVRAKFSSGKSEHGGHIWEIATDKLATEAMNEALDQFTYIYTLRKQLTSLTNYAKHLEEENRALKAMGLTLE